MRASVTHLSDNNWSLNLYLDTAEEIAAMSFGNKMMTAVVKGNVVDGFVITAEREIGNKINIPRSGAPSIRVMNAVHSVRSKVKIVGFTPESITPGRIVTGPLPDSVVLTHMRVGKKKAVRAVVSPEIVEASKDIPSPDPIERVSYSDRLKELKNSINDAILESQVYIEELKDQGLEVTMKIDEADGVTFAVRRVIEDVI